MEKPGWKTTEFWLSLLAMIVAALMSADVFADASTGAKVLGFVSSALAAVGYTAGRVLVKSSTVKAIAEVEKERLKAAPLPESKAA